MLETVMSSVGTIVDSPSIFSPRRFAILAVLVFVGLAAPVLPAFAQAAMPRQGYDLRLTRDDERGWRATF
jgi:hypothetical protein